MDFKGVSLDKWKVGAVGPEDQQYRGRGVTVENQNER